MPVGRITGKGVGIEITDVRVERGAVVLREIRVGVFDPVIDDTDDDARAAEFLPDVGDIGALGGARVAGQVPEARQ